MVAIRLEGHNSKVEQRQRVAIFAASCYRRDDGETRNSWSFLACGRRYSMNGAIAAHRSDKFVRRIEDLWDRGVALEVTPPGGINQDCSCTYLDRRRI